MRETCTCCCCCCCCCPMLHAAYQKCNTNCFNARASPRSPFSQQQQQWICINDEACCLSLSHSLFRYLSHTLTLSPLCSRKQMKKTKPKKLCKLCAEFFMKTENGTKLPSAPSLPREIRHISLYLVLWAKVNLRSLLEWAKPHSELHLQPRNVKRRRFDSSSNRWLPFNRFG